LLLICFVFVAYTVSSQTTRYPWIIGVAWHWTDYEGPAYPLSKQLTKANWIGEPWPTKISFGRMIIPSLNVEGSYAFQKFDQSELVVDPDDPSTNVPLDKSKFFWNADLEFQYSFANNYILNEDSWFDPYIFLAAGATQVNQEADLELDYGLGLNFWIVKNMVGINFEGAYDYVPDFHDYFHFSAGLKIQFGKGKDTDKDGVLDKFDLCPLVPGLAEFDGCPDSDGDKLVDSLDLCPTIPGPISLQGCPDKDGDGIADRTDECPEEPGVEALRGCPDRDNDGVADKDDRCPDEVGVKELKGCPDTDGDGIPNLDDLCPDQPGPENTKGCPDTDGDLVPDHEDECLTLAGLVALKGCPDTDGDGVPDKDDKCPDVIGMINNFGCPQVDTITVVKEVQKEVEEQIRIEAEQIQFETAKYVIRPISYPNLNRIVDIMNQYPTSRFSIDGHTDNVGNDDYNLELSQNRALAVKQYFIERGISTDRLVATGYGETRPIAPNGTVEGRALNRRVEIHFIDK
jgi:outer membrane protein OmpA-like peptidoglycan-associated protein